MSEVTLTSTVMPGKSDGKPVHEPASGTAWRDMGPVVVSIAGHRYGVSRLVRGITRRLFIERQAAILLSLRAFAGPGIDPAAAVMYGRLTTADIAAD
jgi:hypothetical protein